MSYRRLWKAMLVLLLISAFAMPYSASSAGLTGTDEQEEAVKKLQALKLVSGFSDGSLGLDQNITRAQLVSIIVRSFGMESQAVLLKGAPTFSDVKADTWYTGYVAVAKNLAEKQGTTLGRTDGTFDPNAIVTSAEALAFVMKFLGVKQDAKLAWPDNFIAAAVNQGLITKEDSDQLKNIKNDPATRGLAFLIADKAFTNADLAGGKNVYQTYIDKIAPTLTVNAPPAETKEPKITLSGTATGAATVNIGGNVVNVGADGKWSGTLTLKSGSVTYNIVAADYAGNTATKQVTIKATGVIDGVYGTDSLPL